MTKAEIDQVLERVKTWPPERQQDVVRMRLEMEAQGTEVYQLSEDALAEIEVGMAEARKGEFATDEEMAELSNRYRQK